MFDPLDEPELPLLVLVLVLVVVVEPVEPVVEALTQAPPLRVSPRTSGQTLHPLLPSLKTAGYEIMGQVGTQ